MNINIFTKACVSLMFLAILANNQAHGKYYNSETDTLKAMEVVRKYYSPGATPSDLCDDIAMEYVGTKYVPITKQDTLENSQIITDGFDEMTFVNFVCASAKLATSPGYARPQDLSKILDQISYRHGQPEGFPSRMNYAADWILDNKSRGNIKELTEDYSDSFKTKSLDYVSRHRDEFSALKDSSTYDKMRMVEFGYRTFKIPHLKRESIQWKDISADLKDGDLIVLLSNEPDKDIYNIGFVKKSDDGFHLIHASEKEGKVVYEKEPLARYVKRNAKSIYGWRWVRVK